MISVSQHKKFMHNCAHLDTLIGSQNSGRRRLRRLHQAQDGKCMWCGEETHLWWEHTTEEFKKLDKNRQATFEHIRPRSKGGIAVDGNGGCACAECNGYRKDIAYDSFKYLTANPKRYEKWKNNRPESKKKAKRKEKALHGSICQYIRNTRRTRETKMEIFLMAMLFEVYRKYHRVDFYQIFVYNRAIVKQLGEQYGLL